MAMRSIVSRSSPGRFMERGSPSSSLFCRYFSDGKGRIFSEEEKAQENIYIQKMERERLEKMKQKLEKEKAEKEKEAANKKPEGETHKD